MFESLNQYREVEKHHNVDPHYGFLPYHVIDDVIVPDSFLTHFEIFRNLHKYLSAKCLPSNIMQLPIFGAAGLDAALAECDSAQLSLLFSVFSVLSNSYIVSIGEKEQPRLPRQLAVPLIAISDVLEINPIFCLWSTLCAMRQDSLVRPSMFSGYKMAFSFTGTRTEDCFFKINGIIAIKLTELLDIIYIINSVGVHEGCRSGQAPKIILPGDVQVVNIQLLKLYGIIEFINKIALALLQEMDAPVFFHGLRPYLRGYSAYAGGVFFDGIGKAFYFEGASAGQDPYMILLKSFFRMSYPAHMSDYRHRLSSSVRRCHRRFIEIIQQNCVVTELATNNLEIEANYERCKAALRRFFRIHKAYIERFIVSPATKAGLRRDELTGVGGTPIDQILKLHEYL